MTTSQKLTLIDPANPILNDVAVAVKQDDIASSRVQAIVDCMLQLSAGKGHDQKDTRQMVGLAAPQVGASRRIITIDATADGSNRPQHLVVVINPVIIHRSTKIVLGREGCWSCGNICRAVERAQSVTLEGLGRHGEPVKLELIDFVARIAQHEVDHLNGIRFPDRIPANQPARLHLVMPAEFPEYRKRWATWPIICPRKQWEMLKSGFHI